MQLIQTITVGAGGTSSISFSSIPQTYTDLKLVFSLRASGSSVVDIVQIAVNSNSTSFVFKNIVNEDGVVRSYSQTAYSSNHFMGYINANTATSSTFGNGECYFADYTNTSINKSISHDAMEENNSTKGWQWLGASVYQSNTAISSLTLSPPGGTFLQYSSASLYGILKGSGGATAA